MKLATASIDWDRVFELRCRSKRGERLPSDDQAFLERAYRADGERYAALNERIFEATNPWPEKPTTRRRRTT